MADLNMLNIVLGVDLEKTIRSLRLHAAQAC